MRFQRLAPFLLAFLLPLLGVYAWWGGFNPVRFEPEVLAGPYHYAYLEHRGDYAKLPDKQAKVGRALHVQGVSAGAAITVLYSNPAHVQVNERISRTGFLVPAEARVEAPLRVDEIPVRRVLVARLRAAVLLAPSRVYAALDEYAGAQGGEIRMPTVEIFEPSGSALAMGELRVEMPQ